MARHNHFICRNCVIFAFDKGHYLINNRYVVWQTAICCGCGLTAECRGFGTNLGYYNGTAVGNLFHCQLMRVRKLAIGESMTG